MLLSKPPRPQARESVAVQRVRGESLEHRIETWAADIDRMDRCGAEHAVNDQHVFLHLRVNGPLEEAHRGSVTE